MTTVDYNHLQAEIKRIGMTVDQVADRIGMTRSGLYGAFRNDSLKVSKLIAICELLNISIEQAVYGGQVPKVSSDLEAAVYALKRKVIDLELRLDAMEVDRRK